LKIYLHETMSTGCCKRTPTKTSHDTPDMRIRKKRERERERERKKLRKEKLLRSHVCQKSTISKGSFTYAVFDLL